MDTSLASNISDMIWLPTIFVLLGAASGTYLLRRLRLPPFFWLPLVLGSTCLLSYALFYVYFFSPSAGRSASWWAVVISAALFAWQCRRLEVRRLLADRECWLPGFLATLVFAGYLCVLAWPGVSAAYRFRTPLPPEDNVVPRYLADWMDFGFYRHTTPPPISGEGFRSSDRPPLQSGVTLALRPWQIHTNSWTYQIIGTFCQLSWIPAFYALARVIGLDRRTMTILFLATVFSGFFLLNSIYAWPKLLAASLFLNGLSLLLVASSRQRSEASATFTVGAALLALSLLAHGGPFFSLIALPFLFVWPGRWKVPRPRDILVAGAIFAALLTPWLLYQRCYDPPGDRLLKIHLAGVIPIDDRSIWRTLADEYARLTPASYAEGRWANVKEQFFVFGKLAPNDPIFFSQWQQFFHHGPALDFLVFGFLGLSWRLRRVALASATEQILRSLTVYTLIALVGWMIVVFAPGGAMLHHSSYATTGLLFFCASVWLACLPRALSFALLGAHIVTFVVIWLTLPAPANLVNSHVEVRYLALGITFLVAFALSLRLLPPDPHPEQLCATV